jgi:hypothetical protein
MYRLAQVRSVRHTETVHDPAVYQMLTGRKHVSSAGGLTVQPTDFPQMGTAFGKVDRRSAVMPRVIELPETMKMDARILPGQNAGFLGATHDPFRVQVTRDARLVPPEFAPRADAPRRRAWRAGCRCWSSWTAGCRRSRPTQARPTSIASSSKPWLCCPDRRSGTHST